MKVQVILLLPAKTTLAAALNEDESLTMTFKRLATTQNPKDKFSKSCPPIFGQFSLKM